jgi:hypothetical protein
MVLGVDLIELREIINVGVEDRCLDQIGRLSARAVRWVSRAAITGLFGGAAQAACRAVSGAIVGCG